MHSFRRHADRFMTGRRAKSLATRADWRHVLSDGRRVHKRAARQNWWKGKLTSGPSSFLSFRRGMAWGICIQSLSHISGLDMDIRPTAAPAEAAQRVLRRSPWKLYSRGLVTVAWWWWRSYRGYVQKEQTRIKWKKKTKNKDWWPQNVFSSMGLQMQCFCIEILLNVTFHIFSIYPTYGINSACDIIIISV